MDEYEKVRQIEEAHLAESMERLIMEFSLQNLLLVT